jgi:hypothetical protein
MAAQAASVSAIQLAEANARSAIQLAEASALRGAQLRYIQQAESQRTAMTPATNPNVYNITAPPPQVNHTTPGDSSVSYNFAPSPQTSFNVSQVDRGLADSQISLNLSDSWSKGRAMECQSEKNGGARCNPDITICECAEHRRNSIWLKRKWQGRANAALQKRLDDLGCSDDEPPRQKTSPARSAAFVENFTNDARKIASEVIQPAGTHMDEDDDYGYETAGPDKQEDHDKPIP